MLHTSKHVHLILKTVSELLDSRSVVLNLWVVTSGRGVVILHRGCLTPSEISNIYLMSHNRSNEEAMEII